MAYGDESEEQKQERFARERLKREFRQEQRDLRDQERKELGKVSGSKDRRRVKKAFDEEQEKLRTDFNKSSSGGSDKGGIYDLSTDTYKQPPRNQTGQDVSIGQAGVDTLGGDGALGGGDGGSNVEFNGSVLICIDGSPFYIDIPYDSTTGVYPLSDGANFPITAP